MMNMRLLSVVALVVVVTCGGNFEVAAQCSNPTVRQSWSSLSLEQKERYVAAARELYARPLSGQCVDPKTASHGDFTQCHWTFQKDNHGTFYFWPWHRRFIRTYELALQSVDSSVVLPYMDWHEVSQALHTSDIWNVEYFGANGEDTDDRCVTQGTFANLTVTYIDNGTKFTHCLGRKWSGGPAKINPVYPSDAVMAMLNSGDFSKVSQSVEGGPHAAVHNGIGGDMAFMYSTADPVFFLHHGYVDRLWWYWQTSCPAWARNFNGTGADSDHVLRPYTETVSDVLSTTDGPFCYRYTKSESDKALSNCGAGAGDPIGGGESVGTTTTKTGGAATSTTSAAKTTSAAGASATGGAGSGGAIVAHGDNHDTAWLGNMFVGLAPGLHHVQKRAIMLLKDTKAASASDDSGSATMTRTGAVLNLQRSVKLLDGSWKLMDKVKTQNPASNVTVHLPLLDGKIALSTVAMDMDDIVLPTKHITAEYEDDLIPLSFVGDIAYYPPPASTVSNVTAFKALLAAGLEGSAALVLEVGDDEDEENLRHVESLPKEWIEMNGMDLGWVRRIEAFANALVDAVNSVPEYTAPDAIGNYAKIGKEGVEEVPGTSTTTVTRTVGARTRSVRKGKKSVRATTTATSTTTTTTEASEPTGGVDEAEDAEDDVERDAGAGSTIPDDLA
ncbi:hypothetical protein BJ742DRAFT_759397 [Cladochytrium replicatum]|nr:hypothetical protein BJ742DRAFT_759397 [Cladochytrium replicatum]